MQMPTNEQVNVDVTSYYTQKGYYVYGLQVSNIIVVAIITFLLQVGSFLFSFPGFLCCTMSFCDNFISAVFIDH
jgi:hypothetical protein